MNTSHEEQFKVRTWDVDQANRLTLAAACNYCQEIAGTHAGLLGVGADYMQAHGLVWVLSRMSLVLDSRPKHGDTVLVETWPRGTDRLFALRDYELRNEAGAPLGRGRSAWLIVDAASFRPRRPEAITTGLPLNDARDALDDGVMPVVGAEGLSPVSERAVAYSDLDYNGHMNNARYTQWIQDVLPPAELGAATRLRLDINYIAEMRPGASAGLLVAPLPAVNGWNLAYAVEGASKAGQAAEAKTAFRAEVRLG